jgi:hypothetical protein
VADGGGCHPIDRDFKQQQQEEEEQTNDHDNNSEHLLAYWQWRRQRYQRKKTGQYSVDDYYVDTFVPRQQQSHDAQVADSVIRQMESADDSILKSVHFKHPRAPGFNWVHIHAAQAPPARQRFLRLEHRGACATIRMVLLPRGGANASLVRALMLALPCVRSLRVIWFTDSRRDVYVRMSYNQARDLRGGTVVQQVKQALADLAAEGRSTSLGKSAKRALLIPGAHERRSLFFGRRQPPSSYSPGLLAAIQRAFKHCKVYTSSKTQLRIAQQRQGSSLLKQQQQQQRQHARGIAPSLVPLYLIHDSHVTKAQKRYQRQRIASDSHLHPVHDGGGGQLLWPVDAAVTTVAGRLRRKHDAERVQHRIADAQVDRPVATVRNSGVLHKTATQWMTLSSVGSKTLCQPCSARKTCRRAPAWRRFVDPKSSAKLVRRRKQQRAGAAMTAGHSSVRPLSVELPHTQCKWLINSKQRVMDARAARANEALASASASASASAAAAAAATAATTR